MLPLALTSVTVTSVHSENPSTEQETRGGLTRILEVHVVAVQRIPQPVAHDFELHDLLTDGHVRLGDVELDLRVIDLVGQTVTHHLWKIPDEAGEEDITIIDVLLLRTY